MTIYRVILRSLRRSSSISTTATSHSLAFHHHPPLHPQNPNFLIPLRSAFSSAEEAAAERRRRKRRLRIEPPLYALRRDPNAPRPPRDPNAPRLPDSTSALTGHRLNLHNRVQSLIRAGDLDAASVLARQAVFSSTRPTVFTCNAIMAAMHRAGRYGDAKALYQYFFNQSNTIPNIVSYNTLIISHCDSGDVDKGLEVYRQILENAPFSPSPVTYRHLTKGLIAAGRIGEAVDLLREMLNKGHGADSLVFNNVISGFLNLENLDKANEFFDELKERCLVYDGIVNATFMDWFFNKGREKEAMESYRSWLDRNFRIVPASCNVLLEVLLKHGKKTEAWTLFDNMLDSHTPPSFQAVNSDTFNIMVNEYFKLGKVTEAIDVFKKAGKAANSKPFAMDVAGYSNIITRYCENEMIEEAEKMFLELTGKSLSPDVTTYKTLIDAYIKVERVDDALQMYTKMVEAGLRVIPVYANRWFGFLVEKGKVAECVPILTKMGEREPKPDAMSYDMVIRALCKEGNFDTSLDILGQMMRYGVGVTTTLREFVLEAFGNEGRREEIERLLNARFPAYAGYSTPSRPPRTTGQVAGTPGMVEQVAGTPGMPGPVAGRSQMAGYGAYPPASGPHLMAGQVAGTPGISGPVAGSPQMTGYAVYPRSSGTPGMAGQVAGTPGMTGHVAGPHGFAGGEARTPGMAGPIAGFREMAGYAAKPPPPGYPQKESQVAGPPGVAGLVEGTPRAEVQVATPGMVGPVAEPPQMTGEVAETSQMAGKVAAGF